MSAIALAAGGLGGTMLADSIAAYRTAGRVEQAVAVDTLALAIPQRLAAERITTALRATLYVDTPGKSLFETRLRISSTMTGAFGERVLAQPSEARHRTRGAEYRCSRPVQ